jgi:hypothetical protein
MKKKLLVYVAGSYSADTLEGVEENCRRAREVGVQLAKCGPTVGPIVPHQLGREVQQRIDEARHVAVLLQVGEFAVARAVAVLADLRQHGQLAQLGHGHLEPAVAGVFDEVVRLRGGQRVHRIPLSANEQ